MSIELSPRDQKRLVADYNEGHGLKHLSEVYALSIPAIRRLIVGGGGTIRPRGTHG